MRRQPACSAEPCASRGSFDFELRTRRRKMKIGLRLVLVLAIVTGCAKKTQNEQKKEMSREPVAKRAPQDAPQKGPEKAPDKRAADDNAVPLEGPYAALVTYEFDKSRAPLSAIEDDIRKASPAEYPQIEG